MGRFTMTREMYLSAHPEARAAGPLDLGGAGADATIYAWDTEHDGRTRYHALAFHGKANRPDLFVYYRSDEHRRRALANYLDGRRRHLAARTANRRERQAPHSAKVGDIFVCSWGYEQTNIDYYGVTRVIGPHTVEIRKLAQVGTTTAFMQGTCRPIAGQYVGPAMVKRVSADNIIRIASYAVATLWDGRDDHWTAYA